MWVGKLQVMVEHQVMCNETKESAAAGMNVLRLAPPLIITEAETDEAVKLLDRACLRMTPSTAKQAAK